MEMESHTKMLTHEEDLDLLLSLQEHVSETPLGSPGEQNSKDSKKVSATSNRSMTGSEDRKSYTMKVEPSVHMNKAKRTKIEQMPHSDGKIDPGMGKMIELEIFGSDEELWVIILHHHGR